MTKSQTNSINNEPKNWSHEEQRVYTDGKRVVEGSTHGLQEPLLLVDGDQSNSPRNRDIEIEYGHDREGNNTNGNGDTMVETCRPKIPWGGEYAKSIVYGGLDAIVTCFSLVSSISAGHLSSVDVLVIGFANLVADGISTGFGDFLSSAMERDLASSERHVTDWNFYNNNHPHVIELVTTYESLGMDHKDAKMVSSHEFIKDEAPQEELTMEYQTPYRIEPEAHESPQEMN